MIYLGFWLINLLLEFSPFREAQRCARARADAAAHRVGAEPIVGLVAACFWPGQGGGAEQQCHKLAREFERLGVRCRIITARSSWRRGENSGDPAVRLGRWAPLEPWILRLGDRVEHVLWRRLRLDPVRWKPLVSAGRFWLQAPFVYAARASFICAFLGHARHLGVDLLHVQESSWLAGVSVAAARRAGIPVLIKEASLPVLGTIGYDTPGRRRWDRLRRTAWFHAQSAASADALAASGIPRERIDIIPNGVEVPPIQADPEGNGPVLYVGNFSQGATWKAFDVLVDAWARVHREKPEAQLVLVGGGDPSEWQARARALGCLEAMAFPGRVSDPDRFYAGASIFVLPSRVEGMSNALLEAQSWGLPAVVSDIPGNRAVVEEGRNGLVVPVGDAPALADALLRLLSDSSLRLRLGGEARNRMVRSFATPLVVGRLANTYTRLLGECA